MDAFVREITEQPQSLQQLCEHYCKGDGAAYLSDVPLPATPIITGMGASHHAALIAGLTLHNRGVPALVVEAVDLLNYGAALLNEDSDILFVSQSGLSAEVSPIIASLPAGCRLTAITNDPASPVALRAQRTLPLLVDNETTVATKSYINSLALLWLLARHWGGQADGNEASYLLKVVAEMEQLLAQGERASLRWMDTLAGVKTLLFIGHGPHAVTARQAALAVSEWAKVPALSASAGAFRHGLIEISDPGLGAVVFAAPGPAYASALALAAELREYDAQVLVVVNGRTLDVEAAVQAAGQAASLDEFLAPILDIIPAQFFVAALAQSRGVDPGFRYIQKVVTRL